MIQKLSDEDRFSYYLLGHMFNELMSLQKIVGFALPKHEDQRRPARVRPEHAQAMLMFRLASGKIWETVLAINGKTLATTLRTLILPKMVDGQIRLKAVNIAIANAKWLSPPRNGMGFHFPSFEGWKAYIVPDDTWVDDVVVMGHQSGNTFYDAADTVAQAWMFSQYGPDNVKDAVDPLINEMIELMGLINTFASRGKNPSDCGAAIAAPTLVVTCNVTSGSSNGLCIASATFATTLQPVPSSADVRSGL